jgi:uncharacterized protein (DUF302 family)
MTPDGLTMYSSHHGPKETMDRLVAGVTSRGMAILARSDHAAAAVKVAMTDALAAVAKEATEA